MITPLVSSNSSYYTYMIRSENIVKEGVIRHNIRNTNACQGINKMSYIIKAMRRSGNNSLCFHNNC
jgi:hypothetical protein